MEVPALTAPPADSLHGTLRQVWCEHYTAYSGLPYNWDGGEAKALKELASKVQGIAGDDTEQVTTVFRVLCQRLPDWYKQNAYSLRVVNKKFNEIVAAIRKNGNKSTPNDRKADLLAELYA